MIVDLRCFDAAQMGTFQPNVVYPVLMGFSWKPATIPKPSEKSVFRLERKLPRIDDRRIRKSVRINAIRTDLRSSMIGALAKPKSRFFRWFGYTQLTVDLLAHPERAILA